MCVECRAPTPYHFVLTGERLCSACELGHPQRYALATEGQLLEARSDALRRLGAAQRRALLGALPSLELKGFTFYRRHDALTRAEALLAEQSPEVLRRDAASAYALGRLLGERVVIIGCSTGGALAINLSQQRWVGRELAAIILVSPGFRLAVPHAVFFVLGWLIMMLPRSAGRMLLQTVTPARSIASARLHARRYTHFSAPHAPRSHAQ